MSSIIQKHKQISFESLCPSWSRVLHTTTQQHEPEARFEGFNGEELCMKEANLCIVGEACGFTSNYIVEGDDGFCQNCHDLSLNLINIMNLDSYEKQININSFMEHWNELHLNVFYLRYH